MSTNASNEGMSVLYSTAWPGNAPISSTNTQLLAVPIALQYANGISVQIISDGGAAIDYRFQVTDLPANMIQYGTPINGATMRDDTYASPHWVTTANGAGTIAAGPAVSQILLLSMSVYRQGRLTFAWTPTNTAGATGNFAAVCRTLEN